MEAIQNFMHQLTRMQWSDYLDIAIVAGLVYMIIPLIKSTSAMRIARAVLGVIVLAWVADTMHLYTFSYILNQFLAVGVLAAVILFQPELRRMLDRLGSVRLRTLLGISSPVQELDSVIDQTVMACEVMSRDRVGALIVFARERSVEEYMHTGTIVDAKVSEQLIRNIFFTNASLHDGAMIIKDGRIAAAGCVLPLSDTNRLSADLGTRHRAGVGMSEATDAVVVIVSEETGTISVAVGGMLKRHLASQTLERLLRNELCPAQSEEKPKTLAQRIAKALGGKEERHEK